jgi:hypothetical protein
MTSEAIQVSSIREWNKTIEDICCDAHAQEQEGDEQPDDGDDSASHSNVLHEFQDVSDFHDQGFPDSL